MKSKRRGHNGIVCRKLLLQRLDTELAAAKKACDKLVAEQQQKLTAEQVLVDTILQLEEVISFKARIQAKQGPAPQQQTGTPAQAKYPQQQQHPQTSRISRYVTQLLGQVTGAQVQATFTWTVQDWSRAFYEGQAQLPILLDVVAREENPTEAQASYAQLAEQQMNEAVDTFVTRGVLGCIYLETVGAVLGVCAATNHMTQQIETPPPQHWQHVADRMQLTHVQLQQLAAGYKTFQHNQRVQQQAQLAVAQLVNSPNGCSVQLLAAAKEVSNSSNISAFGATTSAAFSTGFEASNTGCQDLGAPPAWLAGAEAHAHAAAALAGRVADKVSFTAPSLRAFAGADVQAKAASKAAGAGADKEAAAPDAAALAAVEAAVQPAADDSAAEEGDPITKLNELMGLLNRSSLALHLLLFNTLTHRQLARMVVASYPFLPRAGPLIEAATAHMGPQDLLEEQSAELMAAAAAAAAASHDEKLSWQFSQQRAALLRTQCCNWWLE